MAAPSFPDFLFTHPNFNVSSATFVACVSLGVSLPVSEAGTQVRVQTPRSNHTGRSGMILYIVPNLSGSRLPLLRILDVFAREAIETIEHVLYSCHSQFSVGHVFDFSSTTIMEVNFSCYTNSTH